MRERPGIEALKGSPIRWCAWALARGMDAREDAATLSHMVDVRGIATLAILTLSDGSQSFDWSDELVQTLCGKPFPDHNDGRWIMWGGLDHLGPRPCRSCLIIATERRLPDPEPVRR